VRLSLKEIHHPISNKLDLPAHQKKHRRPKEINLLCR
jgi:hypothetical protein